MKRLTVVMIRTGDILAKHDSSSQISLMFTVILYSSSVTVYLYEPGNVMLPFPRVSYVYTTTTY